MKGSANVVMGVRFLVQETTEGDWEWKLLHWKKPVRSGKTRTEKQANKALQEAMGEWSLQHATGNQSKQRARLFVRQYRNRAGCLAHVLYCLSTPGSDKKTCVREAASEERRICEKNHWPVAAHWLSKPSDELAGKLWDAFTVLGCVGKKAFKWGAENLGVAFTSPDAVDKVEVRYLSERERASDGEDLIN